MASARQMIRLTIYIGEDKRHTELPLYEMIIRKARQVHCAGATVYRGIQGFGRSTRLHTVEVLFSEDLPIVIEIVDSPRKITAFRRILEGMGEIGLVTSEPVECVQLCDEHDQDNLDRRSM